MTPRSGTWRQGETRRFKKKGAELGWRESQTPETAHPVFHFACSLGGSREPSQQRVKRWGFSLEEALKDPVGRDQFLKFLESEFSSENLRCSPQSRCLVFFSFWSSCRCLDVASSHVQQLGC